MRIKEIIVYGFDELSEAVREKVTDDFRDINTDHEWYDFLFDEWTKTLSEFGFSDSKIHFSGFYNQGDGACFDAWLDLEKAFDRFSLSAEKYLSKQLYRHFNTHKNAFRSFIINECSCSIITTNHRYTHENCRSVECSTSYSKGKFFTAFLEEFSAYLESERKDLSRKIYSALQREYEYLTSDEAVMETIKSNEYEFTATGEVA